jgi:hypothetical protein
VGSRSLRYLASAAFGHTGHSPKIFVDTSGSGSGTGTGDPGTGGPSTSSARSSSLIGGSGSARKRSVQSLHSQSSSIDARPLGTVKFQPIGNTGATDGTGIVTRDYAADGDTDTEEDGDVVDIRSCSQGRTAGEDRQVETPSGNVVEQRIGLAISSPPATPVPILSPRSASGHPYSTPIVGMTPNRAGSHDTSPVLASAPGVTGGIKDDFGSRHRLPPRVFHAHKRSLSAGQNQTPIAPLSPSAHSVFTLTSSITTSSSQTVDGEQSRHPFLAGAARDARNRPPSGQVERSFEDALIASASHTEWPAFASQLQVKGDPSTSSIANVSFNSHKSEAPPSSYRPSHSVLPTTPARPKSGAGTFGVTSHPTSSFSPKMARRPSLADTIRGVTPIPNASQILEMPIRFMRPRSRSMSDIPNLLEDFSSPSTAPSGPTANTFLSVTVGHARSASQPFGAAAQSSPRPSFQGSTSHPTDSSVVSYVNPELTLRDSQDLSEFRDLFYRPPHQPSGMNSLRSSFLAGSDGGEGVIGSRPISGTSLHLWSVLSPVLRSPFVEEHSLVSSGVQIGNESLRDPEVSRSAQDRSNITNDGTQASFS